MIIYFIIIFTRFERSTQHWLMIRTRHRTVTVSTVDLRDAADWGNVNKLVDEPLAVHLSEDPPLVVIPQRPAHGLVVHVRLVLVEPPQPGHRLAVHPLDVFWAGAGGLQQGEEELPEIGVVIVFWSPGSCLRYHSVLRRRGRGRRLVAPM